MTKKIVAATHCAADAIALRNVPSRLACGGIPFWEAWVITRTRTERARIITRAGLSGQTHGLFSARASLRLPMPPATSCLPPFRGCTRLASTRVA